MALKDDLKQRRIELNLTMADVADKVGVSEATISRWESGDITNRIRMDNIRIDIFFIGNAPVLCIVLLFYILFIFYLIQEIYLHKYFHY